MTIPARLMALVLCAVMFGLAACDGDDGGNGGTTGGSSPPPPVEPEAGCDETPNQPDRVAANPPGYVIACGALDGRSLAVSNVSSKVLRFRPSQSSEELAIVLASRPDAPGNKAAASVTGYGWDTSHETFVLPLGGALLASGDPPVSLDFEPDLELSAQALTARYATEWVVSKLQTRSEALVQRVSTCATSASDVVKSGVPTEDILRSALGAETCLRLVDDVLREESVAEPVADDAARARRQILSFAKPVLQDEFISRVVQLLARRG